MYKFKLLYILSFTISIVNSQIETAQESLTIKAKELAKKNDNSSNLLKLSPVKGLTNKNIKISMGIPPIDGFAKKEQGIEIKKDVVDPTWEVKQKFSENQRMFLNIVEIII